jgi:stage V sporulation protein T
MKTTGIVRRIDDLGRVVIPKEIRRSLGIQEGDPLEISAEENGEIAMRRYHFESPTYNAARLAYDLAAELPPEISEKVRDHAGSILDILDHAKK